MPHVTIPWVTLVAVSMAAVSAPTETLPPQTTPFSYSASDQDCRLSVYCPYMTSLEYSIGSATGGHPLSGSMCNAVNTLGVDRSPVGIDPRCFPEGYVSTATDTNEGDGLTPVYPGTACPSGWNTACTTTITNSGSLYPQAWCCPGDEWTCATPTGLNDPAASQRLCQSIMTEQTTIYMTCDPPMTLGTVHEYTCTGLVSAEDPMNGATVRLPPVAVQIAEATETQTAMGTQPSPTTKPEETVTAQSSETISNAPAPEEETSSEGLSRGAITGIAVGPVVFLMAIGLAAFLLYRKRKKHGEEVADNLPVREFPEDVHVPAARGHVYEDKAEMQGPMLGYGGSVTPRAEMQG